MLAATSSPHAIVGHDELALVMRTRSDRPLLLIDIAVPRDVDPLCAQIAGVTLYDIDDLQSVVARNLSTRAEETPRALEIVEEEIHRFARWLGQLDALPTVSALPRLTPPSDRNGRYHNLSEPEARGSAPEIEARLWLPPMFSKPARFAR